jgi:hypothetical protein
MIALPRIDTGSDDARQTLQAIAGWSPSRRGFLTGMLAVAAVPAIPTVYTAATTSVSPWMLALINEHRRRLEVFGAAVDGDDDWQDALSGIGPALDDLVHYQPRHAIDLVAKFSALVPMLEDDGGYIVRQLTADARTLLGDAA